jgi:hypothetical protein
MCSPKRRHVYITDKVFRVWGRRVNGDDVGEAGVADRAVFGQKSGVAEWCDGERDDGVPNIVGMDFIEGRSIRFTSRAE